MISISQMKSLVKKTCSEMGNKFASDDAVNLVLATGIVESRYEYIRQMGDGPAIGFFQVELDHVFQTETQLLLKYQP